MTTIRLTLLGHVPSRRGHRACKKTGRIFPGKLERGFRKEASQQIETLRTLGKIPNLPLDAKRIRFRASIYFKTNHRADWDNACKLICDALQDGGVIADDKAIVESHVYIEKPDYHRPRAVIELEALE